MSVIATVVVPAEDFALGAALSHNPGIRIELERVIPVGSTFIPYFWASDDSVEAIERTLSAEAAIESFNVVDTVDGDALVRVEWVEDVDGLLDALSDTGGTILEAVGEHDAWTFNLRFVDHDDLTAFYRECAPRGISLDLQSVHNPGLPTDVGLDLGITPTQRETLEIALHEGYFDVPQRINLTDLAARLGISDTATSQRIRRGVTALLTATLDDTEERSRE